MTDPTPPTQTLHSPPPTISSILRPPVPPSWVNQLWVQHGHDRRLHRCVTPRRTLVSCQDAPVRATSEHLFRQRFRMRAAALLNNWRLSTLFTGAQRAGAQRRPWACSCAYR
eukprot:5007615-Prymnesium_polylepis.1